MIILIFHHFTYPALALKFLLAQPQLQSLNSLGKLKHLLRESFFIERGAERRQGARSTSAFERQIERHSGLVFFRITNDKCHRPPCTGHCPSSTKALIDDSICTQGLLLTGLDEL